MIESFGRPYSNLALAYVQQGKFEEAIALFRRSIELLAANKEKAISWNRLRNVFRHLKDYRQALVAYQNADELDPENRDESDKPGWVSEPKDPRRGTTGQADVPLAIDDPFPYAKDLTEPAEQGREEDSTATWAPMDPTLFQEDTFEALDPGTLTTWGGPSPDGEDAGEDWQADPGTEVVFPEGDDVSKWIPIPDDQPVDTLEYTLEAVDLAADLEEPPAALEDWTRLKIFGELKPEPPDPVPTLDETPGIADVVACFRRLLKHGPRLRSAAWRPSRMLVLSRQQECWPGVSGQRFDGDEGWIANSGSEHEQTRASSPALLSEVAKVLGAYAARTGRPMNHARDFFNCIKSRRPTAANPEAMHGAMTTVHAANICMWLKRNLKYDPVKEEFINDPEANRLRSRAMREPWII